jgi:hypothetical protein
MNRPEPNLAPHEYKTYRLSAPLATHFRDATCQEVDCGAYANGWRTTVDVSTDLGRKQANYIRLLSARAFTVVETGTLVEFTFPAGQTCFAQHKVPLERDVTYRVVGGDHRGNPRRESFTHTSPGSWVDDFATHTERISKILAERG